MISTVSSKNGKLYNQPRVEKEEIRDYFDNMGISNHQGPMSFILEYSRN